MLIKFRGAEIDAGVPKKVKITVGDKVVQYFDLSHKGENIQIEENIGSVNIEVAYEQTASKKLIGIIIYFVSCLFSANGNEIIQALYIDTLTMKDLKQDVEVKYQQKTPLFVVSNHVNYEVIRKVKKSDYMIVLLFFLLPAILLFSLLFLGFMTFNLPLLIKILFGMILGGVDVYYMYLAISLYVKTK